MFNMRDRAPGVGENDAGMFLQEVPMDAAAAIDPNMVRRVITKLQCYDNRQDGSSNIPLAPLLRNQTSKITNWANITKRLCAPGTRVLYQAPAISFVHALGFGTCVVYAASDDCIGVLHNHPLAVSGLLGRIVM